MNIKDIKIIRQKIFTVFCLGMSALFSQAATAMNLSNGHGISVHSVHVVSERIIDVHLGSPALVAPTVVRVMLPNGYHNSNQSYPVLYLLHGGGGDHLAWSHMGAEQSSHNVPVIIVQPNGGKGSWYADASVAALDGRPLWETYITRHLLPWVDQNFRSWGTRQGRAIAGLSMGGYGAMSYASRHPDLFVSASSFSGAVDTDGEIVANWIGVSPVIDVRLPYSIFGVWPLDTPLRQAHNPKNLAANLRGMYLSFYFGNGIPGPLDGNAPLDPVNQFMGWIQEDQVYQMNVAMHNTLNSHGINHDYYPYGNGLHTAGYWERSLNEELPVIMQRFVLPRSLTERNILKNPGFESGKSPWVCVNSCGTDMNIGLAQSGQGNAWVRKSSGWNDIYQRVQVAAYTKYTLTAWLRTSNNNQHGFFGVRNNSGQVISEKHFAKLGNYTKLTVTFNSGNNTQVDVFSGLWANGDTWLQADNFVLVAGE